MEKIWFFVEGDSEENFIINLIRKKYSGKIIIEKALSTFVNADILQMNCHLAYVENCHNVDKIPHLINELLYMITRTNSQHIFIVCDLEKIPCYIERKNKFENIIDKNFDRKKLHYAMSNPMIEVGYWQCEKIIEKILQIEYESKYSEELSDTISFIKDGNPLSSLHKTFKKYDLKYREAKFSELFFPRVDFDSCQNIVLTRITSILDII